MTDVHFGKEVMILSTTYFGEDDLYPILVVPTYKTEDAADMEGILAHAIQCWSASGTDIAVGPVWSVATDGDDTRRAVGHKLFLKNPLSSESPLYGILLNMPGINTFTGDDRSRWISIQSISLSISVFLIQSTKL